VSLNSNFQYPAPSFGLQYARSLVGLPSRWFDGDPAADAAQTQNENKPNAGGSGGHTQEDLDREFANRAKRAAEAERKKMLESLGVKDEDELKTLVDTQRKADEARKTELEKLADRAAKAEEKATKLESENTQKLAEMAKRLLDSEIKMEAARAVLDKEGKVLRPAFRAEALDDILLLVDRSKITDKDGKYEGVAKALEDLAKAKAYLLSDGQPGQQVKGTSRPSEKKTTEKAKPEAGTFFSSL
jgi:hypothetical protein